MNVNDESTHYRNDKFLCQFILTNSSLDNNVNDIPVKYPISLYCKVNLM